MHLATLPVAVETFDRRAAVVLRADPRVGPGAARVEARRDVLLPVLIQLQIAHRDDIRRRLPMRAAVAHLARTEVDVTAGGTLPVAVDPLDGRALAARALTVHVARAPVGARGEATGEVSCEIGVHVAD